MAFTTAGCHRRPVGLHDFQTRRNVIFAERGDQPLAMDIVVPNGTDTPRPAVLWIHGGGWIGGDRIHMTAMTQMMASFGYVSATADYRLTAAGARFPDPVQDVAAAVRFLRKNAGRFNIDPDRIAVGGDSAGGHLALLVGLCQDADILGGDPHPDVSSRVCAVVDIYGPTDLVPLFEIAPWHMKPLLTDLTGGTPKENPDVWARASPINHVRPDAPPILILHGDRDTTVPYRQSVILAERCRDRGAACSLARVRGAGHGWISIPYGQTNQSTLPLIVQFLARVFAETGPN